jgi:murein DD-endopeptidase MepM/ murein hydrolase activator NlpD
MKFFSPIHKRRFEYNVYCHLTQLFGENKNRLFYGPKGHTGLDFKTIHPLRWIWGRVQQYIKKRIPSPKGHVMILASHNGYLMSRYNEDIDRGIGMRIESEEVVEKGKTVQYQTLYFHLSSLKQWKGKNAGWGHTPRGVSYVKAGQVIGTGGNTGRYTTGPHLHFELLKRVKTNNKWGAYVRQDPIKYLNDDVIYVRSYRYGLRYVKKYFYKGKEYTRSEANVIAKKIEANIRKFIK